MPIDARIALQGRVAAPPDVFEGIRLQQMLNNQRMQERLMRQELTERQAEMEAREQAARKSMAVDSVLSQQGGNVDEQTVGLVSKIDPQSAIKLQSLAQDRQKFDWEAADREISDRTKKAQDGGRLFASAKDQPTWEMALRQAEKLGLDVSKMPTQYDPAVQQQVVMSSMSTEKQLAELRARAEEQRKVSGESRAAAKESRDATEFKVTLPGKVSEAEKKAIDAKLAGLTLGEREKNEGLTAQQKAAIDAQKARDSETSKYRQENLALQRQRVQAAMTRAATGGGTGDDAKEIAGAIMRGEQPPDMARLYKMAGPIKANLARAGYDLAKAEGDWKATQRHLASLNGPQQLRLRQAVAVTRDQVDVVEKLYDEWQSAGAASGLKVFNKAALAASKQFGGNLGATAQALEAQIADFTSELATVYKGGNSSTDESLKLAAQNLKANWTPEQFKKQIGLIRRGIQIRANSIESSQAQGVRQDSPYAPMHGAPKNNDPLGIR